MSISIETIDAKLVEIAAIGKSKHYFGKKYTSEEVKSVRRGEICSVRVIHNH